MNPDVEQQLMTMQFPGTGTAVPAYLPPGGLSASPYGTLLGRPVIPTEACPALGDKGDIIFGDLGNYQTVIKAGGIRSDVSIHIWFDYDITAFRFVLRVGGQPLWNSSITAFQSGSSARGFFATLEARP
jgi:HK97 family phage major capsid protein